MVEANPLEDSADGNYWMRTIPAEGCKAFERQPENKTGIIRYDQVSIADPMTQRAPFSLNCSDEPYERLQPVLPWQVGAPSNEEGKPFTTC